mgnify:CR=1 FL=1
MEGRHTISWVWPLETLALFVYRTYVQPQNFQRRKTERWAQDSHIFKLDKWRANLVTLSCYRENLRKIKLPLNVKLKIFTCQLSLNLMVYTTQKWNLNFTLIKLRFSCLLACFFNPSKWSFQGPLTTQLHAAGRLWVLFFRSLVIVLWEP